MAILTEKQYVAEGGGKCPVCKGTDIVGGSTDYIGDTIIQEIHCQVCQASWNDLYKLDGYEFHDYDGVGRPQALLQDVLDRPIAGLASWPAS